jgi:4-amino-4-deoxy-L-arabinose transferase-like glycosyltransferase
MAQPVSPALFDQFARGARGYLLIALAAFASALFGIVQAPVLDAAEARFVLVTKDMLETGGVAQGTQATPVHLMQETAVRAFSPRRYASIWPYRLPSAFGLALGAVACLWAGQALATPRAAFIGAALFATGVYAGFSGMLATPDALLLGFITLAMGALAQLRRADISQTQARLGALMFWFALACALSAGPVSALIVIALAIACLFAWERKADWLRPLLWWPGLVFASLVCIASIAAGLLHLPHLRADFSQFTPPGYYIVLAPLLLFPATYALPAALRLCLDAVRAPRESQGAFKFLIAWAAPIFVLAELWPAKSPQFVLPAFPAIALMCGAGLTAMRGRAWRSAHPAGLVLLGVVGAVIIAVIAGAATLLPGDLDADIRRAVSTGVIGVLILGGGVAGLMLWRRATARAGVLVACALLLSYSLREHILPDARAVNVSGEVVDALARMRLAPNERRTLWIVGYDEASLVFLTHRAATLAAAQAAAAAAKPGDAMVVEGRELAATQAGLTARGLGFQTQEDPERGLALDSGRRVALYVGSVNVAVAADAPPQNP